MLTQYEPLVKTVISFLRLHNVKVTNETIAETLQNHPDWPNLLCITDSFNKWNLTNGVGRILPEEINELPLPFIAYTVDKEDPFKIVNQTSGDFLGLSIIDKPKKLKWVKKIDFFTKWNGVYIIAEPSATSGELKYNQKKRKALVNSFINSGTFVILLTLSILSLYDSLRKINNANTSFYYGAYLEFFIMILGVFITTLLLWYEIDRNNQFLQKVCSGVSKTNCNAILSSKNAKIFDWLSWSEIGFFYFSGGYLSIIILNSQISTVLYILSILNLLVLPYTFFSVYYQAKIAKQWCILCLAVQVLLVGGFINCAFSDFLSNQKNFNFDVIFKMVLLYILPFLSWYSIKPYLLKLQSAKNIFRSHLKTKFNTEIFSTILKKQKKIDVPLELPGIVLGNPNATNKLIKICNPYCWPCSLAHTKIEHLIDRIENLQVLIIFFVPDNQDTLEYKAACHLLSIAEQYHDINILKTALDKWYLPTPDKKDLYKFMNHYSVVNDFEKQSKKLSIMIKWCTEANIHYTPTIFMNNYQLPEIYDLEDLEYFLLD